MRFCTFFPPRPLPAIFGALVALIGATAPSSAQKLTVVLDWAWRPHHAPFVLAQARGFYKEEGLDVTIEQGRGSASSAVLVGQGNFDVGHINITNAAQAISKGVPIKAVGLYQHKTASAFIGIKGKVKLDSPQALKGLRIGSTPGGSDGLGLAIFSKVNQIPLDQLNVVALDGNTKTAALLTGKVDVVSGDTYAYLALVRAGGYEPVALSLADLNVPLLGFGFVANEKALGEKPEAIRKFIRATRKAYALATQDFRASCQLLMDKVDYTGAMDGCIEYFSNLADLSTPGASPEWGRQSAKEWDDLIRVLREVGEVKADIPASAYYTTAVEP